MNSSLVKRIMALALVWAMLVPLAVIAEAPETDMEMPEIVTEIPDVVLLAEEDEIMEAQVPLEVLALEQQDAAQEGENTDTEDESAVADSAIIEENAIEATANAAIKKITLSKSNVFAVSGDSFKLVATVKPLTADPGKITWLSSDTSVAKVSSSGKVTTLSEGTATIIAKSNKKSSIRGTCKVVVSSSTSKVGSIKLNKADLLLQKGDKFTLKATVNPSTATNQKIKWTTSNKKIATVKNGVVTAGSKAGTAIITAAATDQKNGVYAECKVQVYTDTTKAARITLSKSKLTLEPGSSKKLTAKVLPATSTQKVTWKVTAGTEVASVSSGGKVTGKKSGIAVVCAQAGSVKAYCRVAVTNDNTWVSSIEVEDTFINMLIGGTASIKATALPASALDKTLTYKSNNKNIVRVSSAGKITAVGVGEATITVSANDQDGKVYETVDVTVENTSAKASKITLNKSSVKFKLGETDPLDADLEATVSPLGASNKVTWSSSDESIATVKATGDLTAHVECLDVGTVTITATHSTGKKASCKFKVINAPSKVTSVILNKTSNTVKLGVNDDPFTLTASLSPENIDDQDKVLIWSSSDPDVATVDQSGKVEIRGAGSAVISAYPSLTGSSVSGECALTVINPNPDITGLKISKTTINAYIDDEGYTLKTTVIPSGSNKACTFKSDNTDVATVDSAGTITYTGVGTANITVTATNGTATTSDDITATCVVTVVNPTPDVTKIALNRTAITATFGVNPSTYTIKATVSPVGSNQTVKWQSSDSSVATVTSDGVVAIAGVGTATITATATNGTDGSSDDKTATCTVTVNDPGDVDKVTMSPTSITNTLGEDPTEYELSVTFEPAGSSGTVTWSSSNTNVVTVKAYSENDKYATATIVGEGSAVITAKTDSGLETNCTVKVVDERPLAQSMKLNLTSINAKLGDQDSYTLKATVTPARASTEVRFTTDNDEVVSLPSGAVSDGICTVSLIGAGTATITAYATNGTKNQSDDTVTATCTVNVEQVIPDVTRIVLNKASLSATLGVDTTGTLKATVAPVGANQKVVFTSSNTTVATVDRETGVITYLAAGTTTITATATNGTSSTEDDKTATCTVKVITKPSAPEQVVLSKTEINVSLGTDDDSYTLKAFITPEGAEPDTVTWKSDNTSVATVSSAGKVTIRGIGVANITATINFGTQDTSDDIVGKCVVTVTNSQPDATKVTLNMSSVTLKLSGTKTTTLKYTVSPKDALQQAVTWTSSNSKIAKVNAKGKITALKQGTVTITATTANGIKATCKVTVKK